MKWSLVTGNDFGRSIKWAKNWVNPMNEHIKKYNSMTKIVCVSDTHGYLPQTLPHGDILIHAGDWTHDAGKAAVVDFLDWFQSQPHAIKIFIAGNHDLITERAPSVFRDLYKAHAPDCIYLEDSSTNACGLTFWGSPVSPRFFNWAWNRDRGEEIRKHWDLIPANVDVLVTHGPPFGLCDLSNNWNPATGKKFDDHLGCKDLYEAVLKTKPMLHVFGHIHGSGGKQDKIIHDDGNKTLFVNAGLMDESYIPNHKPVEVYL